MQKWLNLRNESGATHADIYLFDAIDEWYGIGKKSFIEQVNAANASQITLHISSPGGNVDDALAMHDFIKSHPAKVTAKLSGIVASAATFLALAADKVEMSENALFMIHNVWTMAMGTADELRKEADLVDKFEERIVNIYQKKTGMRKAAIQALLNAETWMDANEAKSYGFVDKVIAPSKMAAKASVESLQSRGFLNIPTDKLTQLNNYEPEMDIKEEMNNLYSRIENLFKNKTETPENKVVEVRITDHAEFQNKVIEFENKFEALNEEIQKVTILKDAAQSALEIANTELETLRNENARLSGKGVEEVPGADPTEAAATGNKPALNEGQKTLANVLKSIPVEEKILYSPKKK